MTSCTETYRLAPWRSVGARQLEITEDPKTIPVEIVAASADALHLRLTLADGSVRDETFRASGEPLCGDLRGD